jgi:uncharacterized membrane protein
MVKGTKNSKDNSVEDTNSFSIVSLVLGILFFVPLAPILAIIFGFIALNQIKRTGEQGRGMAIAGIILGFFWIALLIIILAFLAAVFASIIMAVLSTVTP